MLLVFLRVFVSLWLELSNKYHEDSKTRRNTRNLAKKARSYELVIQSGLLPQRCFRVSSCLGGSALLNRINHEDTKKDLVNDPGAGE